MVPKVKRRTLSTEFGKVFNVTVSNIQSQNCNTQWPFPSTDKRQGTIIPPLSFVPPFTFDVLSFTTVLLETKWDNSCWTSCPALTQWLQVRRFFKGSLSIEISIKPRKQAHSTQKGNCSYQGCPAKQRTSGSEDERPRLHQFYLSI